MDVPISEPATPSLQCYGSLTLCKTAEDSGYHTSFTPGSIDLTGTTNETPSLLPPKIVITGHIQVAKTHFHEIDKSHNYSTLSTTINDCLEEFTPQRRGVKRSFENDLNFANTSHNLSGTPTSIIAGEIQKLVFDDTQNVSIYSASKKCPSIDKFCSNEPNSMVSYPTTPVKKICKGSCKLSPFNRRKFARKVEFATHSLSCERKVLQPVKRRIKVSGEQSGLAKVLKFRQNQKLDIIRLLNEAGQIIPLEIILNHLSNQDIYNFVLVSDQWRHIWESIIGEKNKKKQKYVEYLDAVSTNVENWENGVVPRLPDSAQSRTLREIHNEQQQQQQPPVSPPGTPRTNRFRKFTRAASIDTRTQLSCVQCTYPAKVTKEPSGEVWADCTNATCAHQFCKSCKGKRHPGTSCLQYDLNEPSPSKRKKNFYPISSKKSKKNLCRLLC